MMMSLGLFQFSLPTLAYQELQRRTSWRWAQASRVGARPSGQYLGPGDDTVSLTGWIAPDVAGDPVGIETLRAMADEGLAWPLVDGTGAVHGAFAIEAVDERQTLFFRDGKPRRIDFAVDLRRQDDSDAASPLAGLLWT